MKPLIALFVGALLVGPVPAVTVEGNTLTLDEDEAKVCAGGECLVVSKEALISIIREKATEAAANATILANETCWSRT